MGSFAARSKYDARGQAKVLFQRRALTPRPSPGGSHQPLRQLSYYSLPQRCASPLFDGIRNDIETSLPDPLRCQSRKSGTPPKSSAVHSHPDAKSHPPRRMAFCFPVLVTGLPANHGRWFYPPRLSQAILAGLPPCGAASLADALAGCLLRLWAGRISPAAGTSLAHSI